MQNLQLSLLSLLGGKPAGEAFAGAGLFAGESAGAEGETGAETFFSFVDEMLTAQKKTLVDGVDAAGIGAAPVFPLSPDAARRILDEFAAERLQDENAAAQLGAGVQNLAASAGDAAPIGADASSGIASASATAPGASAGLSGIATQDPGAPMGADGFNLPDGVDLEEPGEPRSEGARHENRGAFEGLVALTSHDRLKAALAVHDRATPDLSAPSALGAPDAVDAGGLEGSEPLRLEGASATKVDIAPVRDQIVAALTHRHADNKIEIRLDPPELGKVTIGFERDGDHIVRAVVSADSPETLDLMRRNADVFERALEQQGFAGLDLRFADQGARQNGGEAGAEAAGQFVISEGDGPRVAETSLRFVAEGRLDRRL